MTADDKKPVEDAIVKVREAIKTDDIKKIDEAVEALNKVYEPCIKKLYPSGTSTNGQSQFTPEQMAQMMKDPKFQDAFKNGGSFNEFQDMFKNGGSFNGNSSKNSSSTTSENKDDVVDAEFTENK